MLLCLVAENESGKRLFVLTEQTVNLTLFAQTVEIHLLSTFDTLLINFVGNDLQEKSTCSDCLF